MSSKPKLLARAVIRTQLDKVCDTSSRYALGGVQVIPGENENEVFLTGTDGRKMATVKAEGFADQPRIAPVEVLKTTKSQRAKGLSLERNGRWEAVTESRTGHKVAIGDDVEGRFPRAEEVYPDVSDTTAVTLDGRFIDQVYHALGGENPENRGIGITLFVPPADKKSGCVETGVAVLGEHGIGVIMPLARDADRNGESVAKAEYESLRDEFYKASRAARRQQETEDKVA